MWERKKEQSRRLLTCTGVKAREEESPDTVPAPPAPCAAYCLARFCVLALSFCFWERTAIRSRPPAAFFDSVPSPTICGRRVWSSGLAPSPAVQHQLDLLLFPTQHAQPHHLQESHTARLCYTAPT